MSLTPRQKNIVIIAVSIVFIIIFIGIVFHRTSSRPVTLEMWGIIDDPHVISSLTTKYHRLHPNVTIKYTAKKQDTYHQELLQAFASDKSPDIFMLFGNWLPLYEDKITPLKIQRDNIFNLKTLNELYPEAVSQELVQDEYLKGIPLYIDTLALYYNKDIFNYYNIALPPATWEEVLQLVPQLRKTNPQGQITRVAITMGTGSNTNWSTDILAALMMQKGSSVIDPQTKKVTFQESIREPGSSYKTTSPGKEALNFYTQFANPRSRYYTWSGEFLNSIPVFIMDKTSMLIGYNRTQKIIKENNPGLNYGIAPLPHFADSTTNVNVASIMAIVVSKRSSHSKIAWDFLKFLAQKDNAQFYFLQTKNPPARRDLIQSYLTDPQAGVFISQTLSSKTWYQPDFQQVFQVFNDAIDSVLKQISEQKYFQNLLSCIRNSISSLSSFR